jgi:hypothetical protein
MIAFLASAAAHSEILICGAKPSLFPVQLARADAA